MRHENATGRRNLSLEGHHSKIQNNETCVNNKINVFVIQTEDITIFQLHYMINNNW